MNIFNKPPFIFFPLRTVFNKESDINGEVLVIEDKKIKRMVISGYTQSKTLNPETGISDGYWDIYLHLIKKYYETLGSVLMLGFGGGTSAVLIGDTYETVHMDAVEIDPVVLEAAHTMFDFDKYNLSFHTADAYEALDSRLRDRTYDVILADVYHGGVWPEKFDTPGYIEKLKSKTAPDGIVMFNRIYTRNYQEELGDFINLLLRYFKDVRVQPMFGTAASNNVIIYASDRDLTTID